MRRRSRVLLGAVAACAALMLSACSPSVGPAPQSTDDLSIAGTWVADGRGDPHLVLGEDLTVKGTDGCNGITTTYRLQGEVVEFENFMSTLKACPGVDTWLSAVKTATVDGEKMTVLNKAGDEIGVLHRAP